MLAEKNEQNQFFTEYKTLKENEDWKRIIKLGNEALLDKNLTDEEQALIGVRLTSNYFYLADHETALKYAQSAYEDALNATNPELMARSIYLISAGHRAIYLKTSNEEHKKLAKENIDYALNYTELDEVTPFTKAKIYFNAGALEQDVFKDFTKASNYFSKAMGLFHKDSDDYDRTAIRNIRCLLELGQNNTAKLEVERMTVDPNTKTGVQFLLLKTRVYLALPQYKNAYKCATEGLEKANEKGMKSEAKTLTDLLKEILEKAPDVATHLKSEDISKDNILRY